MVMKTRNFIAKRITGLETVRECILGSALCWILVDVKAYLILTNTDKKTAIEPKVKYSKYEESMA